jgi:putative modified peptide
VSQPNVERVVGRLATDEGFRRRFREDAAAALREVSAGGFELNSCERQALLALAPAELERFAAALDPRIQKSDLKGEAS